MLAIADRWFTRHTITDGLTLLTEPHVHPLLRCNIWHLRGREQDLLIDTGLGISSLAEEISDLIDKPLTTVATHIHYDHVGSLHEFGHCLVHSNEALRMTQYEQEFASLDSADFPGDLLSSYPTDSDARQTHPVRYPDNGKGGNYLISARPDAQFEIASYRVPSAQSITTVDDGDVIDLGNRSFAVMHLPGHSPGSIGLYEQASQTLFSGDAIYDGMLLDELPDSSIADYVETMKKLRALPVNVVHAGHEPSFGQTRLHELIDAYLDWRS